VVYNDMAGDANAELDGYIRQAYGKSRTIVDTGSSQGFVDPVPTAGDLPRYVKAPGGGYVSGYALIVYIVDEEGRVAEPVIVKGPDPGLCQVALQAMAQWRFRPATLNGVAVASTAAQEFNFGPRAGDQGFKMDSVIEYQPNEVLIDRLPPNERMKQYIRQVTEAAHNFFVGDTKPETLSLIFLFGPSGRRRLWLVSSVRPDDPPELAPLEKLILAVPTLEVRNGPVAICMTGVIAGGDGAQRAIGEFRRNPIPEEWRAVAKTMDNPPPFSSDEFLNRLLEKP
jgi:hypothetical protein